VSDWSAKRGVIARDDGTIGVGKRRGRQAPESAESIHHKKEELQSASRSRRKTTTVGEIKEPRVTAGGKT